MLNEKPLVWSTLETVEGFKKVFASFPTSFTQLPCISFYEVFNGIASAADDDEYLSEIVFMVDLWGNPVDELDELAIEVDAAMKGIGFIREFSADVNDADSDVIHKTMRFKLLK